MARRVHSGRFADSWNRILCLGKAAAAAGPGSADMRCPPLDGLHAAGGGREPWNDLSPEIRATREYWPLGRDPLPALRKHHIGCGSESYSRFLAPRPTLLR